MNLNAKTGRTSGKDRNGSQKRSRAGAKITLQSLESWALRYLDRFPATATHLRQLLLRKVARSPQEDGVDRKSSAAMIDAVIEKLMEGDLLDDARYAQTRAQALHRRGGSARAIRATLAQKGVGAEHIEEALATLGDSAEDPELEAAIRYARRRRLGPFGPEGERAQRRRRDLTRLLASGTCSRMIQSPKIGRLFR